MKQYIMLGIIAAGILILAVFLFLSLRKKSEPKSEKPVKSLFDEVEESENLRIFPDDYKTEILIGKDSDFDEEESDSAVRSAVRDENEDEKAADDETASEENIASEDTASDEKAADDEENYEPKTQVSSDYEEYALEGCNIKSLNIDEDILKKINMKACSIESIYIVPRMSEKGEERS